MIKTKAKECEHELLEEQVEEHRRSTEAIRNHDFEQ